jgi:phospholipase C
MTVQSHDRAGSSGVTRREFLEKAGAAGLAVAGGTLWATAPAAAQARRVAKVDSPIEHLVIACQENRSFEHYYGYAPLVQAAGYGPPPGYFQPDSSGGKGQGIPHGHARGLRRHDAGEHQGHDRDHQLT